MSEQAKILAEIGQIVMNVFKTGSVTMEESNRMQELETLLHKQRCFKEVDHPEHTYQGEVIASLFFDNRYTEAIDKLYEYKITPEDFFGFVEYHYDEDHEDEELTEMFTQTFIEKVNNDYLIKCKSE
jgi:membrane-anchored protein YejM (alkaline phosphatase superfamily)